MSFSGCLAAAAADFWVCDISRETRLERLFSGLRLKRKTLRRLAKKSFASEASKAEVKRTPRRAIIPPHCNDDVNWLFHLSLK
jgi:hypothetical protein